MLEVEATLHRVGHVTCTCAHADTFCKRNHRSASGLVCNIQRKLVTSLRREMPTQGFVCSVALQGHVLTALSGGNWVQKVLEKESDFQLQVKVCPRGPNTNFETFTSPSISGCDEFRGHRVQRDDHRRQET